MSLAAPIFCEVCARRRKDSDQEDLRQHGLFSCCHNTEEKVLGRRVRIWPSAIITALGELHTCRWGLLEIETQSVMCSWAQSFQPSQESPHMPSALWAVGPHHAANKSLCSCTASPLTTFAAASTPNSATPPGKSFTWWLAYAARALKRFLAIPAAKPSFWYWLIGFFHYYLKAK